MFRAACLSSNNDRVRVARILDDLDTLLAENAKLRAVAEAAREVRWKFGDEYEGRFSPLDEALAALEAP